MKMKTEIEQVDILFICATRSPPRDCNIILIKKHVSHNRGKHNIVDVGSL